MTLLICEEKIEIKDGLGLKFHAADYHIDPDNNRIIKHGTIEVLDSEGVALVKISQDGHG